MRTLGISCNHDAGVVVLENNNILYAANEERFSRKKFDFGFPKKALANALHFCGISEFNAIVMDGKSQTPNPYRQNLLFSSQDLISKIIEIDVFSRIFFGKLPAIKIGKVLLRMLTNRHKKYYSNCLKKYQIKGPIFYVDHHQSHAASTAFLFGKKRGLVVVIDAFGEGICASAWAFENNTLKKIKEVPGLHSIGCMYLYITNILGFKIGQEGKVTGLAARGNYEITAQKIFKYLNYDNEKKMFQNCGLGYGINGRDRLKKALLGYSPEDIAAGAQHVLEELALRFIRDMVLIYGDPKPALHLAGGVFANVSLNRRIADEIPNSGVWICPNMGDGGLSLGNALLGHHKKIKFTNLYLGYKISPSSKNIPEDLVKKLKKISTKNIVHFVAKELAKNKLVAVARGKMEYGPRALGNRSILASARFKKINKILNQKLKRTEFMPFAPIVREEDAKEYFKLTQAISSYQNMTTTCFVKNKARREVPAIVHVDGTARPQIINKKTNAFIHACLTEYKKQTGIGVLVNTSFNMHEEPIVANEKSALEAFLSSKLDVLILGNKAFGRQDI